MPEKLNQRDPKWSNIKLGTSSKTIGTHGCTITCIAMLIGTTPDVINEKLKSVNGFAQGNLVIWSKLKEAFPGVITSATRIWSYDNDKTKQAISDNGGCLVEVDGSRIGATKHWVLYKGNQMMNDPWFGNEKSTSYYRPTGLTVIEVERQYEDEDDKTCDEIRLERDKNWNLYKEEEKRVSLLEEKNRKLSEDLIKSESKLQTADFRDSQRLEQLSKDLHTPYMSTDKERSWDEVLAEVKNYVSIIHERDEYKDKYEREVQERKKDYEKYQAELKQLRAEKEELENKLRNLGERINEKLENEVKPVEIVITKPIVERVIQFIKKLFSKGKS